MQIEEGGVLEGILFEVGEMAGEDREAEGLNHGVGDVEGEVDVVGVELELGDVEEAETLVDCVCYGHEEWHHLDAVR